MEAQLILENGKRFKGRMFGAEKDVVGEVVFSTGMGGYQETLTDPSLAGQIVTMTFPLIGNYGINSEDMESGEVSLSALVVREKCDYPSNFRCEETLDSFLKRKGTVGIEGIDTRALTKILRDSGCMRGVIMKGNPTDEEVEKLMQSFDSSDVVMSVTTKNKYTVNENGKKKAAFIDLGTKKSIIESLVKRDCAVTVFGADTSADEILKENPDFVFLSSGPGNPDDLGYVVDTVKALVGKLPIFGICTGHLVIGLALGAKTDKLKFGHHGENQPVKDADDAKVYITSQGHNYVLTDLPQDVLQSFTNVNDGTCEGIKHKSLPIQSVQFHPEASPGPKETGFVFDRFLEEVK